MTRRARYLHRGRPLRPRAPACPHHHARGRTPRRGRRAAPGGPGDPGLLPPPPRCFIGAADFGPRTDEVMARTGVTTMVDGGSAGAALFEGMRRLGIERARTRIPAFLHISAIGLAWMRVGEVHHLAYADVDAAVGAARAHADLVVGIKVRQGAGVGGGGG